jgi:hypothetical protein
MPGAWVDSPPRFRHLGSPEPDEQHPNEKPAHEKRPNANWKPRSIIKPSEPLNPTLNPYEAVPYHLFYHDLVRGFSDFVTETYRRKHVDRDPNQPFPGMFVLRPGPSDKYLSYANAKKAAGEPAIRRTSDIQVDPNDLMRPVLSLDEDFYISPCRDRVPPPESGTDYMGRRIAIPKPRVPGRTMSTLARRRAPPMQDMHENHQCVDIERLSREFMFWFLKWRAAIPRKIYPDSLYVTNLEKNAKAYFERLTESWEPEEKDESFEKLICGQYKQALHNLVWEIKHPLASRPGASNPDGTKLRNPWIHGDEYIHGVTGLTSATESWVLLRLVRCMDFVRQERKKPWIAMDWEWQADNLFSILDRKVAPSNGELNRINHWVPPLPSLKHCLENDDDADMPEGRKRQMLGNGLPKKEPSNDDDNGGDGNDGDGGAPGAQKEEKLLASPPTPVKTESTEDSEPYKPPSERGPEKADKMNQGLCPKAVIRALQRAEGHDDKIPEKYQDYGDPMDLD